MPLRRVAAFVLAAAAVPAAGACGAPSPEIAIQGAVLAEADGVVPAAEGPTVALTGAAAGGPLPALPDADVVRVAIDRTVPYRDADRLIEALAAAGKTPVYLVSSHRDLRGFVVARPTADVEAIRLVATDDGKACVSPPGVAEAKCVQRPDKKHIDRAFVRELTREAHRAYHLDTVHIDADPGVEWGDIVRAIDGARTCCADTPITVGLRPAT